MPIYEYQCNSCGKVVEVLTSSASQDVPPQQCSCGTDSRFVRLFSSFSAHDESHPEPQFAPCGREDCCGGCAMKEA